jgi:hypothetical protein
MVETRQRMARRPSGNNFLSLLLFATTGTNNLFQPDSGGVISGFVSLDPYLGVFLALLPPLAAGMGVVDKKGVGIILITVVGLHVLSHERPLSQDARGLLRCNSCKSVKNNQAFLLRAYGQNPIARRRTVEYVLSFRRTRSMPGEPRSKARPEVRLKTRPTIRKSFPSPRLLAHRKSRIRTRTRSLSAGRFIRTTQRPKLRK